LPPHPGQCIIGYEGPERHHNGGLAPMSRRYSRRSGLEAILLAIGLAWCYPAIVAQAVGVGQLAPYFELADLDGGRHNQTEAMGQVLLLYFLGHNASVCEEPARSLDQDLYQRYEAKGLLVFGIDCWDGSREQLNRLRQSTGVSYPLLMSGSSTAAAYNVPYNSFVLIDGRGVVRYVSAGPSASAFNLPALQTSVARLLDEANVSKEKTWGAIKTLYVPRLKRAAF
jgi:peroxiredoxin